MFSFTSTTSVLFSTVEAGKFFVLKKQVRLGVVIVIVVVALVVVVVVGRRW